MKLEPDAVTILYSEGGALVPLANLRPICRKNSSTIPPRPKPPPPPAPRPTRTTRK
jgi:hypothetical protein